MMRGRESQTLWHSSWGNPTNKAVPTGAEPVERRAGTKGNADQQSTRRTRSRVSVSQALERMRQVARERRKERFIALFHHIGIELTLESPASTTRSSLAIKLFA